MQTRFSQMRAWTNHMLMLFVFKRLARFGYLKNGPLWVVSDQKERQTDNILEFVSPCSPSTASRSNAPHDSFERPSRNWIAGIYDCLKTYRVAVGRKTIYPNLYEVSTHTGCHVCDNRLRNFHSLRTLLNLSLRENIQDEASPSQASWWQGDENIFLHRPAGRTYAACPSRFGQSWKWRGTLQEPPTFGPIVVRRRWDVHVYVQGDQVSMRYRFWSASVTVPDKSWGVCAKMGYSGMRHPLPIDFFVTAAHSPFRLVSLMTCTQWDIAPKLRFEAPQEMVE